MEQRIEHDTMGEVAVPADKLWGAQTQRSFENFPIGEEKMPPDLIHAFGVLKEACAAAIEDPDFVTFMNNNGQAISYLDAQGYADYLKQAATDVAAAMDAVGL